MTPKSEPRDRASSRSKQAGRSFHRSRKGCPECRARKIKCDEKKPECTQCRTKGRACGIIDGLFRPVSFSSGTFASSPATGVPSPAPLPTRSASKENSPEVRDASTRSAKSSDNIISIIANSQSPAISPPSPTQARYSIPVNGFLTQSSSPGNSRETVSARSLPSLSSYGSPSVPQTHARGASHPLSPRSTLPAYFLEENNQDRIEVGFFLRHFAEGSGRWMDIFTSQRSYFSQHVVQLASQSQLFRYSACAMAAKQLGQMKDSTQMTKNTPQSNITASNLLELESNIDFTWYGAKYYEKAILLMAQQISPTPNSTSHLSPSNIYELSESDDHQLSERGYAGALFRVLSACILCAYEDLNATMRAWSGHLDGISKLLGPLIDPPAISQNICRIPHASRALKTAFWYFALDDMLNSLVLRQRCRLNPEDFFLWQKMGLPLDNTGRLMPQYIDEQHQEAIPLKPLIRLLCKIINHDSGVSTQWSHLDTELTQWYQNLPTEFLSPITHELSVPETWFGSDTCAIAMAFYHMARILLLVNQPRDLFLAKQQNGSHDLLSTYNALQRDLKQHAMEIIAITHGMSSITVQKYMVQPLYLAGRCLSSPRDRKYVISLLKRIENNIGVFTGYRIRDLSEEWGIPLRPMEGS